MTNKTIALLCITSMAVGAAVTRIYWQKTITETKTVTVDHVVTQTHVVVKPDGTKIIDSTKTKDETKKKDVVVVKNNERYWRVSVGVDINHNYIGLLEYKLVGPVSVGVIGSTGGTVGAVVGVEF